MKTVFHSAEKRGFANHGWLKSHHSFSFANYYNPEMMNFGTIRVLNYDFVEGGMGFGKHPHQNMEIITIPLDGDLKHEDNMVNSGIIKNSDIQVMSAGSGIMHSEQNASLKNPVKFLQIWIVPNKMNVSPRYDQMDISENRLKNEFQQILSPSPEDQGVWIHQDAWINYACFDAEVQKKYNVHRPENGAYIFVLNGKIKIGEQILSKRDAMGIWDTTDFGIETIEDAKFIVLDIPMEMPTFAK